MAASPDLGSRLARFALDRLAFGPRPDGIDEVLSRGIERWVDDQLHPVADAALEQRLAALPTLGYSIAEAYARFHADVRGFGVVLSELQSGRVIRAVHARNQLQEVLTDFWLNHFNVFAPDEGVRFAIGRYEADVIRPRVLGRFRDLLGAVASSYAMMVYLDNHQSSVRSINENYARELMELHTLGVDGGYSQQDVQEVARAFTGWGVELRTGFVFRVAAHDQQAKTVLGQRLPARQGRKDGEDVLDMLAKHPATARFVSKKLARRFVADDPPASLVDRCAATFTATDGDIAQVMRTMVGSREFWDQAFSGGKVKTPHEYAMSALRALGAEVTSAEALVDPRRPDGLFAMGMPPYQCLPPTGWSDRGADWIPNPGSHLARMNLVLGLVSASVPGIVVDLRPLLDGADPGDAAAVTRGVDRRIFGGTLPAEVLTACAAVASGGSLQPAFKAVGIALASPPFQVK